MASQGKNSNVDNEIRGRLALVTGASGGIGAACAEQLYANGAHLALTYSSNKDAVDAVAKRLGSSAASASSSGGDTHSHSQRVTIHQVDLGSADEIRQLCADVVAAHGGRGVDILVSNAGVGKRITQIWDISLEDFDHTLNVNLRASFLLVKGTVEHMRDQRWGRIIFISSIAAYGAGLNGCHYAASKGGLTSLMKNLASRLGEYNISVNDVAPAMIEHTGMIPSGDKFPGLQDSIPLQRLGRPEEVANLVVTCAKTGYMTGQSILLTGGLRYL